MPYSAPCHLVFVVAVGFGCVALDPVGTAMAMAVDDWAVWESVTELAAVYGDCIDTIPPPIRAAVIGLVDADAAVVGPPTSELLLLLAAADLIPVGFAVALVPAAPVVCVPFPLSPVLAVWPAVVFPDIGYELLSG